MGKIGVMCACIPPQVPVCLQHLAPLMLPQHVRMLSLPRLAKVPRATLLTSRGGIGLVKILQLQLHPSECSCWYMCLPSCTDKSPCAMRQLLRPCSSPASELTSRVTAEHSWAASWAQSCAPRPLASALQLGSPAGLLALLQRLLHVEPPRNSVAPSCAGHAAPGHGAPPCRRTAKAIMMKVELRRWA